MATGHGERAAFTGAEATEIRSLLDALPTAPPSVQRTSAARLRRLGVPASATTSRGEFEALVSSGALTIDYSSRATQARITPHPSGRIFRVAVGVKRHPVPEDWNAFNERYQWFGKKPQALASGDHLFVLAVDRWRSAVVGLYEAVSAGADRLPDSPDPDRWPFALGVRPLAAIPPPRAERIEGQQGPQSGLPERIYDEAAIPLLYAAVEDSPGAPGPQTLEQRVQELEWVDLGDDVVAAVIGLSKEAYEHAVEERAIEIGGWNEAELAARAWYTGSGETSHIRHVLRWAIRNEHSMTGRLVRPYGSSPYAVAETERQTPGTTYRRASGREAAADDRRAHLVDIDALERATKRHMELQDRLADELSSRGVEPRSPASWEPQFDLAFEHSGIAFIVEVKTGDPVAPQQVRLGVGQLLEYCHLETTKIALEVRPVLLLEAKPPDPWYALSGDLGIAILPADDLDRSLAALVDA